MKQWASACAITILFFVTVSPRTAVSADIHELSKEQQLEVLLDVFFHENPMLTLLQQAPMGSLMGFHPVVADQLLSDAFSAGLLKNSDIGWFWVGDPKLNDPATQTNLKSRFSNGKGIYYDRDFVIYSREAVRKLLEQGEAKAALHNVGFTATANVDEAIQALNHAVGSRGNSEFEQYQHEVIYGLFSGFPVRDVLQFSNEARLQGPKPFDRDFGFVRYEGSEGYMDLSKGFAMGGYLTFDKKPQRATLEKRRLVKRGVQVYQAAREAGMSNVSIFTRWPSLMCADIFSTK